MLFPNFALPLNFKTRGWFCKISFDVFNIVFKSISSFTGNKKSDFIFMCNRLSTRKCPRKLSFRWTSASACLSLTPELLGLKNFISKYNTEPSTPKFWIPKFSMLLYSGSFKARQEIIFTPKMIKPSAIKKECFMLGIWFFLKIGDRDGLIEIGELICLRIIGQ